MICEGLCHQRFHSPGPEVGRSEAIENVAEYLEQHDEEEPHVGQRTVFPAQTRKREKGWTVISLSIISIHLKLQASLTHVCKQVLSVYRGPSVYENAITGDMVCTIIHVRITGNKNYWNQRISTDILCGIALHILYVILSVKFDLLGNSHQSELLQ